MALVRLLILLSFSVSSFSFAKAMSLDEKIAIAKTRCTVRTPSEPYFFMDMFKSDASIKELDDSYKETYNQEERLFNRASFIRAQDSFVTSDSEDLSVTLPKHFIKSVILHIENAIKLNYVKYVFFPDMGHSHLQIPQDYFDEHHRGNPPRRAPLALNDYLNAPGLKSLYHTAEKMTVANTGNPADDWYLQWRFYTRNILVDSEGNIDILTNQKSSANTVSRVPGYHWNAGISISAHKNGCFPFEDKSGQIQYFDISAWDPPYDCINNFCGKVKSNIF